MPLREFGGVSRTELLKEMWVPVTLATELTRIGNHPAAKIDHAADYAEISLKVLGPLTGMIQWVHVYLWIVGIGNNADMHIDIKYDYGVPGTPYANTTGNQTLHFGSTANNIYRVDITNLVGLINWFNTLLGLYCVYNSDVGSVTNCYVVGVELVWR